jgi:hypothetical protein
MKKLFAQLYTIEQGGVAKLDKDERVTTPGVRKHLPDARKLVTEYGVKPAA